MRRGVAVEFCCSSCRLAVLALIARLLAATVARWTLLQAAVMDEVLHVHA